ncbi:MAG: sigma-54 interaction domain-containing protein [Alphaproteobacteria bacterium]
MTEIIKGKSEATQELKKLVQMVSQSNSTVLLRGETGCGKDVVARAIHQFSKRSGDLINVNCAAIPSELLESELFGHEKGAFTGADAKRQGRFEASDNGTLFLDEIGDMPLPLQAKLLRAIETRSIQRVGGKNEIKLNLRLVCATHQNIEKKIDEGHFRADLFYRINVFPIEIPSLSERREDIPILVNHILNELKEGGSKIPSVDSSGLKALQEYIWPGNVRELRNVIERATIIFPGETINAKNIKDNLLKVNLPDNKSEKEILWNMTSDLAEISIEKSDESSFMPHPKHYKKWFEIVDKIDLRRHLSEVELILIEGALKKSNGSVTEASKSLKINRTTLIEKMKKYSIPKIGGD